MSGSTQQYPPAQSALPGLPVTWHFAQWPHYGVAVATVQDGDDEIVVLHAAQVTS